MNDFKIGDMVKVKGENIVFPILEFTRGSHAVPDGWLQTNNFECYNPDKCELYNGAVSVFERDAE